jgi:hypothetical protein
MVSEVVRQMGAEERRGSALGVTTAGPENNNEFCVSTGVEW